MKRETILIKLQKIFKDEISITITENTKIEDLKLHSITEDILSVSIEDTFYIFLEHDTFDHVETIDDLITYIENCIVELKEK